MQKVDAALLWVLCAVMQLTDSVVESFFFFERGRDKRQTHWDKKKIYPVEKDGGAYGFLPILFLFRVLLTCKYVVSLPSL